MTNSFRHTKLAGASDDGESIAEALGIKTSKNNLVFTDKPVSCLHEYYLVGPVEDASEYTEWFNQIRHAGEQDIIRILINSPGGDLMTTIQFLRVMRDSKATIITSVEGQCCSAATLIFLAGHQFEIADHSLFLLHNYSSGVSGKGTEMFDQLTAENAWFKALLDDVYGDFLTPTEIAQLRNNKDIWLDSDRVVERLVNREKIRQKRLANSAKSAAAPKPKAKAQKPVQPAE